MWAIVCVWECERWRLLTDCFLPFTLAFRFACFFWVGTLG